MISVRPSCSLLVKLGSFRNTEQPYGQSDSGVCTFGFAPQSQRTTFLFGGLTGGGLVQIERHDLRALPAEQGRDGASDPRSCPGNRCDFTAEIEQLLHALKYYTLSVKSTKDRGS